MNNKRLIVISVFLLIANIGLSQYTNIEGPYITNGYGMKGRLKSVQINRNKGETYVTIEVMAIVDIMQFTIVTAERCYIKAGNWTSNCYGAQYSDDSIINIRCGKNFFRWYNVAKGETRKYTLVFDAIPPGLTNFSLINEGVCQDGFNGYGFSDYTINNPSIGSSSWTETDIQNYADTNNDGICGIYESSANLSYRLGCIRDGNKYVLIYLNSGKRMSWWSVGDIKAVLRPSATSGLYKGDWYMSDKAINSDCYVLFDGLTMKTIINNKETNYLKMYPNNSANSFIESGSQIWSGTGFALNKGYIVTNYHVVEGAKSIKVNGINGDFNVSYNALVVATDIINDLAIIKINESNFSGIGSIPYSVNFKMAEVGDNVYVLGYPLTQTMGEEIKLTNGIINSRTGFQGDASTYQMSATIQPGNSGGPMFDDKGNVIGIVCAKHVGAENVGYAIKTSYLKNLVESFSLPSILPTNNMVSSLPLSSRVKKLKKYVYLIICSK